MPKISPLQLLTAIFLSVALLRPGASVQAQTHPASSSTTVAAASPASQPENNKRVQDVKFFSKALQREMQYRVVLPKDYFATENRYPVLYLLHGLTGHYRSFEAHSNLTRDLERYQLMPYRLKARTPGT